MYCRNCGTLMDKQDKNCVKCNYVRGFGASYCPDCGAATTARARKCPDCGATLFVLRNTKARRRTTAALLAFFLGMFGIHNFYLGYMRRGLLQLIISVLSIVIFFLDFVFIIGAPVVMGLWGFLEGIKLASGNIRVDADGNFLT